MKAPFPGCGALKSFLLATLFYAILAPAPAEGGEHSLGLGAHFWKTVDAVSDDGGYYEGIEDEGQAFIASYRYRPGGPTFFQVDLEYYPDGYGGFLETVYTPMVFFGVGRTWYVAGGVGIIHTDQFAHIGGDDFTSNPYFLGRIGWNFDLLPGVGIDLNATYAADSWNEVDRLSSDATTLGAVVRFSF